MRHSHGCTAIAVLLSLLYVSSGGETAPAGSEDLVRQRRAAEELWNELTEGERKAESHEHWERIVRRSTYWYSPFYSDDTQHIVNVQEYYRQVLENDWSDPREVELAHLMRQWNSMDMNAARVQSQGQAYSMREEQKPIRGRYIVMLSSAADEHVLDRTIALLQQAHVESEGRIRTDHITPMRHLGLGFTATMNSKTVELIKKHPFLEVLEEDIALRRASYPVNDEVKIQESSIPWNLDRIDQRSNNLDGHFLPEGQGEMASIYIIDTGVHYSHDEFDGRAHYAGFDAIDKLTGSNLMGSDCHGHGTHCAGTAAGKTYGVAKKATIYSVRALGCTGSGAVSGIVEGMDFIAKKVAEGAHNGPVVFSMSLGVMESSSLNAAVQRAMEMGIVAVGAAGNQAGDSCNYSPASAQVGIAVGATDEDDNALYFSNAGTCTDVYAPGKSIKSANSECDTCTKTLSGTSMAAPHVAGYMAVILSLNPKMNAKEAKQHMIEHSTKDVVGLAKISSLLASRTPNRLLYIPQAVDQDSDIQNVAYISSVESMNGRP